MLQIQQKLTPYNYTAMSNKKNTFIVVHYTGATGTAKIMLIISPVKSFPLPLLTLWIVKVYGNA